MQYKRHIHKPQTRRRLLLLGGAGIFLWSCLTWSAAVSVIPAPETFPTGVYPSRAPRVLTELFSVLTPAYAAGLAQTNDDPVSVVLEDFNDENIGGFPDGWKAWRGDNDYARHLYTIQEEDGNRYVHARDDGTSIIIRRKLKEWNPHEYPILSWRWRARALPKDGDERIGSKNDSAVAVYVVLDQNFFRIPKTLKYVWSTTLPVGTRHRRDGIGRPHVIVLESGTQKLGQWVAESVNVYEDFVHTFGKKPPKRAVGIGMLTDSNATKSDSEGDYDDFIIHRYRDGS